MFSIYNTWKQKSGENWGRPGNTYHMNEVRWTRGGPRDAVPDYKYVHNKTESEFLTGQVEYL